MNDELLIKAFQELFPDKNIPLLDFRFSGKFKSFNANVSIEKQFGKITKLKFSLSKNFLESEDEIFIGLIQHLLNKVYKTNINTLNQELYLGFTKNINRYAKVNHKDEQLLFLFNKLNKEYFNDLLDVPNLSWGRDSTTVLGHYTFSTDTITISNVLRNETDLLEYVLYHEMLHKKHGFVQKGTRSNYHTTAFRNDEKKFRVKDIEKKLNRFVAKKRIKKLLFKW